MRLLIMRDGADEVGQAIGKHLLPDGGAQVNDDTLTVEGILEPDRPTLTGGRA